MTLYYCNPCRIVKAYGPKEAFLTQCVTCENGEMELCNLTISSVKYETTEGLVEAETEPVHNDVIANTLKEIFKRSVTVDDILIRRNKYGVYRLYVNGAVTTQGHDTLYNLFKSIQDAAPEPKRNWRADRHGADDLD